MLRVRLVTGKLMNNMTNCVLALSLLIGQRRQKHDQLDTLNTSQVTRRALIISMMLLSKTARTPRHDRHTDIPQHTHTRPSQPPILTLNSCSCAASSNFAQTARCQTPDMRAIRPLDTQFKQTPPPTQMLSDCQNTRPHTCE